ncbi:hypothetical protein DL764_004617 [Monosporascus ibericus]|uniref:Uncharacterized protein n=1 Tax=Monosporascus ibericus TaxID=155417 RepID=A0A4Q4TBZ6_9PEZI|nr:hypothetical protein DL764_004617 [Monosporascus ibericus]
MATTPSNESLCFAKAAIAKKNGTISYDEYYHHLLKHLTGETHEHDIEYATKDDYRLRRWDPFGYSVQCVSKEMERIEDATAFENVFKAYRTGTVDHVIAQHDKLDEKHAKYARRLLAMRALLDRRADVLKFCLSRGGFECDDKFKEESYSVEDPETFAVLEESEFRKLHPRKQPPWVAFDVGGAHPVDW